MALPGDIRSEGVLPAACCHRGRPSRRPRYPRVNNAGRQQSNNSITDLTTEQFDWTSQDEQSMRCSGSPGRRWRISAKGRPSSTRPRSRPMTRTRTCSTTRRRRHASSISRSPWPSKSRAKAFGSMPSLPARSGPRSRSPVGKRRRILRNLGQTRRSDGPDNRPNWRAFMSFWPPMNRATPPARSTPQWAARGGP